MKEELFDYSGKDADWVKKIFTSYTEAAQAPDHPAVYDKIAASAKAELRRRNIRTSGLTRAN